MLKTSKHRNLGGLGQQCFNMFDCKGILNCCQGYGPANTGLCLMKCNLDVNEQCQEDRRCRRDLNCCNGKCMNKDEHCVSHLANAQDIDVYSKVNPEQAEKAIALSEVVVQ